MPALCPLCARPLHIGSQGFKCIYCDESFDKLPPYNEARKSPTDEIITRCPDTSCKELLRLPLKGPVRATCPRCRTSFLYDGFTDNKTDIVLGGQIARPESRKKIIQSRSEEPSKSSPENPPQQIILPASKVDEASSEQERNIKGTLATSNKIFLFLLSLLAATLIVNTILWYGPPSYIANAREWVLIGLLLVIYFTTKRLGSAGLFKINDAEARHNKVLLNIILSSIDADLILRIFRQDNWISYNLQDKVELYALMVIFIWGLIAFSFGDHLLPDPPQSSQLKGYGAFMAVLLSYVLMFFVNDSVNERTMLIHKAQEKGLITVDARGVNVKELELELISTQDITVIIPVGVLFVSNNQGTQNMISARTIRVPLFRGVQQTVPTEVYCANRFKDAPTATSSFKMSSLGESHPLRTLSQCLENKEVDHRAKQMAIWLVSDDLGRLTRQQAKTKILAEAERKIRSIITVDEFIREAKSIFPNLSEEDLDALRANTTPAAIQQFMRPMVNEIVEAELREYEEKAGPLLRECGYELPEGTVFNEESSD